MGGVLQDSIQLSPCPLLRHHLQIVQFYSHHRASLPHQLVHFVGIPCVDVKNIPLIGLKVIREYLCSISNHVIHRPKESSAIKRNESSTVFREHNQWEDYKHLLQKKSRRSYCLLLEDYPHWSEGN